MAVQNIEDYGDTLKVILKPTDNFPIGYFYCDSDINTLNLVNSYSWYLRKQGKNTYVMAKSWGSKLSFHREYAHNIMCSYPAYIDHVNGIEIDNTDINLNSVTNQQNGYNQPTRGYSVNKSNRNFQPQIKFDYELLHPYGIVKTELEACIRQYQAETDYLKLKLKKDEYYMYDFLKDRRNDLDILDLERTKQITPEEATYQHVIRHAKDNAWYYYRYNLADYFSQYHIPIPHYYLDTDGFMTHPVTGQRLCPFN